LQLRYLYIKALLVGSDFYQYLIGMGHQAMEWLLTEMDARREITASKVAFRPVTARQA
jgi:hypothetical protein